MSGLHPGTETRELREAGGELSPEADRTDQPAKGRKQGNSREYQEDTLGDRECIL